MLQEVINRRLFSVVREREQLTYDANFNLMPFEKLDGAWYLVTVTSSPVNAKKALLACRQTLKNMRDGSSPITRDNLESARRVVINKHSNELASNRYWCEQLTGVALDAMPRKDISCVRDFVQLAEAITVADLQRVLQVLDTDDADTYGCLGTSGPCPKEEAFEQTLAAAPDEHGTSHVFGMGRR